MKLIPSLFKSSSESSSSSSSSPWPWPLPACRNYPKTLSFRAQHDDDDDFKTSLNSTNYVDDDSDSSELLYSHETNTTADVSDYIESVIRGLKSDKERLFFEPEATKNINNNDDVPVIYKESVVMTLDSKDPFGDFKRSMEEMVEAHGIQEWECLEQLLTCYLKVNCKSNHGYIVGAFVDLLVTLAFTQSDFINNGDSSKTTSNKIDGDSSAHHEEEQCLSSTSITSHFSFTSPLSFCSSNSSSTASTSASLSLLEDNDDDDNEIATIRVSYPL